jgi:hypothetical protein
MSFAYTRGKRDIALGDVHFDSDDIRLIPVMTNTTADTDEDAATVSAIATLDEFDGGAAYPKAFANRDALASEAVNEDTTNDRAEFDATDFTFSALEAGTRSIAGIVVYQHKTSDADSVPLLYIDSGGFPFTANGGDLTLQWNSEGIAQIT